MKFQSLVRPIITILCVTSFLGTGIWGLATDKLTFADWFTHYGPITMLIVGYWFAERKHEKVNGSNVED